MEKTENISMVNELKLNKYNLSKESWFNILSYLDLKTFLNLEKSSKRFRTIFINFYSEKNTIEQEKQELKNKTISKDDNPKICKNNISIPDLFFSDIKRYKKNIIEKYYNFLIQIPYVLAEFCSISPNKTLTDLIKNKVIKINEFNTEINETLNCNSSLSYYNCYYTYNNCEFITNNKFMIFYNNTLNVYEINSENIFEKKFSQFFYYQKIIFFGIIQNSIFLINDCGYLIIMNVSNYATNIKRIRFYIPEELVKIFYIGDYFVFLTKEDNFYYIKFEEIFMKNKSDEELERYQKELLLTHFPKEDINIFKLFPIKINKNYNGILDVNSNCNNYIMFIDNNYDIYGLNISNFSRIDNDDEGENKNKNKKNKSKNSSKNNSRKQSSNDNTHNQNDKEFISFYKVCQGIKFTNYYTMSFGENYWILLEQNYKIPLIDWSTEQVSEWFERELGFEEYLNVIKYQKVNGKNIIDGDRKYFKDILGMNVSKINKLCNKEIKKVEDGSVNNIKAWGYGNNRSGQLGLTNIKYSKNPLKLEIPENEMKANNDFIVKIICSNSISVLKTKRDKIYICGNFNIKEKQNILNQQDDNSEKEINEVNKKKKGNKGHKGKNNHKKKSGKEEKMEKEEKEKSDKNIWVEISNEIKKMFVNNSYLKLKDIYIRNNILYIFGLKLNKKDFS